MIETERELPTLFSSELIGKFKMISRLSSLCCIFGAVLVLIGWYAGNQFLKTPSVAYSTTKVNTAVGFLLSGISLWLILRPGAVTGKVWSKICSIAVLLIGLASMTEDLLSVNLHIDQFFIEDSFDLGVTKNPGRVPLTTSLCFIFAGMSLYWLDSKSTAIVKMMQSFSIFVMTISIVTLLGYLYDVDAVYNPLKVYTAMSFYGALLFYFLAIGILFSRPTIGIVALICNDSMGGVVARRLLPFALLIPIVLGFLRLLGEEDGLYSMEFGVALNGLSNILIFAFLILWNANLMCRLDLERKRLSESQESLIKDLRYTNRELEDFAYIISHDLKTPLRGIRALSEWIVEDFGDKLDEQGKSYLALLSNRIDRMNDLINGILLYSRAGEKKEQYAIYDLNRLLSEVIDLLPNEKNVVIKINGSLPKIFCQPIQIKEVFQNLLSNAIKYMDKENGEITISCADEGEAWRFSVADNGPGIEEKHFETIFQMFQTLASKEDSQSTGIGLSIVKKIVEKHGGKVWINSEPGKGSTFHFSHPKSMEGIAQLEEIGV